MVHKKKLIFSLPLPSKHSQTFFKIGLNVSWLTNNLACNVVRMHAKYYFFNGLSGIFLKPVISFGDSYVLMILSEFVHQIQRILQKKNSWKWRKFPTIPDNFKYLEFSAKMPKTNGKKKLMQLVVLSIVWKIPLNTRNLFLENMHQP